MAKIIVLYEQPKSQDEFEKHYFDVHIPLVKKIQRLKDASVNRVVQTQNTTLDLYLVAQLEFESMDDLNDMLVSEEGKAVLDDVGVLTGYLPNQPVVTIVE